MATEELVTEQFKFMGIDLEKEVLKKCVGLSEKYNIDAETFVEQWMAFSLNQLNGASPTIDGLKLLERKEFSKQAADHVKVPGAESTQPIASVTVYGLPVKEQSDKDVLFNYLTSSPKGIKEENDISTPIKNELMPATYSPSIGYSGKYASRTNAGSILHSHGDESLLENLIKSNNMNNILDLNISHVANDDGDLYTKAMFGFELLHEKASIFDNHIAYLSECIMKKNNITETSSLRHKSQNEEFVAGRVECDADARLNSKCVVLQGTWEQSLSLSVPLDLDQVNQYSLFPGQVILVRGNNSRGDKFIGHEIFCDASKKIADHRADMLNTFKGEMSLVIASGPYTTSDNLAYEPLKDFIQYVGTNKPHIVIMTGPFMDSEHIKIKDNTMAETFKSFFDKLLDNIAEISTSSPMTKIYIVSNLKDVFHFNVYPTQAYSSRRKYSNIHFIPDPCTLNINGIIVGVTSTDILMHISQEEVSQGMGGDKLGRLAGHLLGQQSYYPLWPPAQPADAALWAAHAHLPCAPHLLILPSNFRYFVKDINGCIVINPEHLAKGTGGGTFARILINVNEKTTNVAKGIAAQILRI